MTPEEFKNLEIRLRKASKAVERIENLTKVIKSFSESAVSIVVPFDFNTVQYKCKGGSTFGVLEFQKDEPGSLIQDLRNAVEEVFRKRLVHAKEEYAKL